MTFCDNTFLLRALICFRRTINLVSLVHRKTYHFYEQQVPGRCTGLMALGLSGALAEPNGEEAPVARTSGEKIALENSEQTP